MRVLLHIGVWKTGSSAIQTFLAENAGALAREGVVVPRFSRRRLGHNAIVAALKAGDRETVERLVASLRRDARRAADPVVVLTSEHYWPLKGAQLERLAAALRGIGARVDVLAYVRPQEEMWRSLYAQQAKMFHIREDTPLWGEPAYVGPRIVGSGLYFGRCLTRFRKLFGPVRARLYDRVGFVGGDVVSDFMAELGVTDLSRMRFPDEEVNASLGWKGVAFAIWCARHLDETGLRGPERMKARPCLAATTRDMAATGDADWQGRTANFLSHEERLRIRAHYAEDTRRLARRFFGGEDPFPPVRRLEVSPRGLDAVPREEFERAKEMFLRRLHPGPARRTIRAAKKLVLPTRR